jgi:hypothetical protein
MAATRAVSYFRDYQAVPVDQDQIEFPRFAAEIAFNAFKPLAAKPLPRESFGGGSAAQVCGFQ